MALKTAAVLPDSVVTIGDLSKLRLELEQLADFLLQARLRKPGKSVPLPRVSKRLDEMARAYEVTLKTTAETEILSRALNELQTAAPQIHISFATDPSDAFLVHIIHWFRENIHPQVMLTIGLQPTIAAGFVLRSPSHYYDCSLRKHFQDNKALLTDALNGRLETGPAT